MVRSRTSRRLLTVAAAVCAFAVMAAAAFLFYRAFDSLPKIREFAGRLGPYAPLGFVLVQVAQIILAPVPGTVLSLASGYLFGVVQGTLITMAGVVAGTTLVLVLSRSVGRRLVVRFVSAPTLDRWDNRLQRWGLTLVFFLYLIPNPLGDITSYLAGLTRWPLSVLVVVAAVGRLPGVVLACFIGYKTASLSAPELAAFVAGFGAVATGYYLLRKKIGTKIFRTRD